MKPPLPLTSAAPTHPGTFTVLLDGACPLCKREGEFMRRLDRGRGGIAFVDIADPAFDAGRFGLTLERVMGSIHGIAQDGRVVEGMEVFRLAYRAVGHGWFLAPTGWPVLKPLFDRAYRLFARFRLRLTRRGCIDGRCVAAPRT